MYVNPGSVIAISVIFPVLGFLAVTSRFVLRVRQQQHIGVDDWLCVPALAFLITTGALLIYGVANKIFGYHSPPDIPLEVALTSNTPYDQLLLKLEWVINLLNPVGTGFVRLSFVFFYRRLFRGKAFNIASWTLVAINIVWMIASVIAYFAVCSSVEVAWASVLAINTYCKDPRWLLASAGIIGLLLDITIWAFPFFWIWRLQMQTSKKLAVCSVFLCGLLTIAASALRTTTGIESALYQWGKEENFLGLVATNDTIGVVSILLFWQYVENGTGLIVCCLPSLKPLFMSQPLTSVPSRLRSWVSNRKSSRSAKSWKSSSTESDHQLHKPSSCITVTRTVDLHHVALEDEKYLGRETV